MDRRAQVKEAKSIEEEEKEVWTVEMMAVIGWKMTWSEQAEARVKKEEVWIMASPVRPSLVGPQLGRASWLEVFF